MIRGFGMDMSIRTAVFKMDNQQGPPGQHVELCSMLCGSLDGRGVGGEWIHVWLSLFAVQLKLSLIGYTPMQNKQKRLELWLLGKESKKDSKIESPI